jgi:hypothetical protein
VKPVSCRDWKSYLQFGQNLHRVHAVNQTPEVWMWSLCFPKYGLFSVLEVIPWLHILTVHGLLDAHFGLHKGVCLVLFDGSKCSPREYSTSVLCLLLQLPCAQHFTMGSQGLLLKAVWYPSLRHFSCVCEQVSSCRSAVCLSACKSQSWAWLLEPILTFVARIVECAACRQCRTQYSDFRLKNKRSFWSILRVGSIETLVALSEDLHCGFSASNLIYPLSPSL